MADSRAGTDTAYKEALRWVRSISAYDSQGIEEHVTALSVALEAARQEAASWERTARTNLRYFEESRAELAGLREERDLYGRALARIAELNPGLREELEGRETEIGGNRVARGGG